MMGATFIENLERMIAKYPYQKMHKILFCLVLAMLKTRTHPAYMLESINATALAKKYMAKAMRDLGSEAEGEFELEMFELTQSIALFSALSQEEASAIEKYCGEMAAKRDDGLETFMKTRFKAATDSRRVPMTHLDPDLGLQVCMMEAISGFYDERFVLRPEQHLNTKELLQAATEYYEGNGFSVSEKTDYSIAVEKDDTLLNVVISNFGNSVHASVESLG
jgi:hypothetical protein